MLAVQIAAYSSRLADKEEIMQNSNTDGEHVWNGGQIVAWVVLLFFLGSIAKSVGKRAVEKDTPRKSPKAGLSHSVWKSRKGCGISTFPTAQPLRVNCF
jgi:hypothetical protein